ncbi:fungal-specific transcription factor domain-containing protein [Aspergillus ambiguus]|uniref:transcription factor domain-containing protein n=1 Tax=Aspergillus ambiguus TaxID=176160 RepID=UPI003CCCF376
MHRGDRPCKARKVKCGEEKPACLNCVRQGEKCDYSIRLNWGGRTRRRSSVESPGSQSSGQSAHLLLTLSPSDTGPSDLQPIQLFQPAGVLEEANGHSSVDGLSWEVELPGDMTIGTSYPRGLHDIQEPSTVPDQSLHNTLDRTTDKNSVDLGSHSLGPDMPSSWSSLPSQTTMTLSGERIPNYSSSIPDEIFPAPGATSFPTFHLSTAMSRESPYQQEPDNSNPAQYSSPPEASSIYASYDSQSPSNATDAISPHSGNSQLVSTGLSPNIPNGPSDTTAAPEDFFTKVMNGHLPHQQSHGQPQEHTSSMSASIISARDPVLPDGASSPVKKWHAYLTSVTDNYGLDSGRPDLDLNKNDDHSAIDINYALDLINSQSATFPPAIKSSEAPGRKVQLDGTKYTYYSSPVPINIPRYLSPLPSTLVQTPINLMYFHHFLNHTAKMLVAHDCGNNPFVSVLPTMAIGDSNLLNLMLAYSASHRARYLDHPEPANRIAHWVSNVFPALRLALEDPHEKVTDSHLAAAIMLLSLKIISPSTFEVPIPWQSHLKLARDLYVARKPQMAYPGNPVGAFLSRWLGYLDIMGTLSCRHSDPPLLDYYSVLNTCCTDEAHNEFSIDCFTGFTPRTGLFLMRLGQLVHQCDNERFDPESGTLRAGWTPSATTVAAAEELITDLGMLHTHAHADKNHFADAEATGIIAMDGAFRYAGFLHLHRRVLDTSPADDRVREAIVALMQALWTIRAWDSVEVAALFPLFTAGCEAQEPEHRRELQERFEVLDGTGMKQIQSARRLIERCWEEGLPWIALAQGEFLG